MEDEALVLALLPVTETVDEMSSPVGLDESAV